jgi:MFS family permease
LGAIAVGLWDGPDDEFLEHLQVPLNVFHIQAIAAAKGWSHELVAFGFASYAISHAATLLLLGGLIDRFGATAVLPLMIIPMLFGLAALGLLDAPPVLLLFLGLMGRSSALAQTTVTALWAEIYGVARLGTIRSFATMLMVGERHWVRSRSVPRSMPASGSRLSVARS